LQDEDDNEPEEATREHESPAAYYPGEKIV